MSTRPLTAPEVRRMFAASDKADADRLERLVERELKRRAAAVPASCGACGNKREDCYCLPSS